MPAVFRSEQPGVNHAFRHDVEDDSLGQLKYRDLSMQTKKSPHTYVAVGAGGSNTGGH
jgi:hypothetical protein